MASNEYADGFFDVVVGRYSAHHRPHPRLALAEFHRLLRPGGCLLLSDIVTGDHFTVDTHLQALELLRDPSHLRDHTEARWLALPDAAGFGAEVVRGCGRTRPAPPAKPTSAI